MTGSTTSPAKRRTACEVKRTPLQRKTPLRASASLSTRTPVKAVSDKRRRRDQAYEGARQAALSRAGGRCEIIALPSCIQRGEQVHHVAGRGGRDPHRLSNLLVTCHVCHTFVHENPALSYEKGWMARRN